MKTVKLTLPTLIVDDQSGGYDARIFPDKAARLAYLKEQDYDEEKDEKTESDYEEDEYENGYFGSVELKLKIDDNGKVTLKESVSFHGGQ